MRCSETGFLSPRIIEAIAEGSQPVELTVEALSRRIDLPLLCSPLERSQLRSIVRSRSLQHSLVRRAQIVLLSAAGAANSEVARRCGVSAPVVSLWRQRYQQRGIAGLHAELRPGRPRSHSDEQVAALLLGGRERDVLARGITLPTSCRQHSHVVGKECGLKESSGS